MAGSGGVEEKQAAGAESGVDAAEELRELGLAVANEGVVHGFADGGDGGAGRKHGAQEGGNGEMGTRSMAAGEADHRRGEIEAEDVVAGVGEDLHPAAAAAA